MVRQGKCMISSRRSNDTLSGKLGPTLFHELQNGIAGTTFFERSSKLTELGLEKYIGSNQF
jgi:hypothetical protein